VWGGVGPAREPSLAGSDDPVLRTTPSSRSCGASSPTAARQKLESLRLKRAGRRGLRSMRAFSTPCSRVFGAREPFSGAPGARDLSIRRSFDRGRRIHTEEIAPVASPGEAAPGSSRCGSGRRSSDRTSRSRGAPRGSLRPARGDHPGSRRSGGPQTLSRSAFDPAGWNRRRPRPRIGATCRGCSGSGPGQFGQLVDSPPARGKARLPLGILRAEHSGVEARVSRWPARSSDEVETEKVREQIGISNDHSGAGISSSSLPLPAGERRP
jgi:hypothetical protein